MAEMSYRFSGNQENHFDSTLNPRRIIGKLDRYLRPYGFVRIDLSIPNRTLARWAMSVQGDVIMSGQVVLYFEDQADALRFALAAGSVMAGDNGKITSDLVQETARVTRIRLDAVNAGNKKQGGGRVA